MLRPISAICSILILFSCASGSPTHLSVLENETPLLPLIALLPPGKTLETLSTSRSKSKVKGILLHHTKGLSPEEYISKSANSGWLVHYLVDKKGRLYGLENAGSVLIKAAPKMDNHVLHLAWEGDKEDILKRPIQRKALVSAIQKISKEFNVPLSNSDVSSFSGIFTHTQGKKKFGAFLNGSDCGNENVLRSILEESKGSFFSEMEWKDRYGDWVLRKERPFVGQNGEIKEPSYDKGRGVTPTPKTELESVERTMDGLLPEEKRLRYNYRGMISADCVVLHFTAINDYDGTILVLEKRNLAATFLADKDGKIYQLLDSPLHMAAAATGTNRNCFQIEIVGKDTEMLLANPAQTAGVVKLVKELSEKYNIPLNNKKVESLKGVFSHTQAKKKWGGSIFLDAQDFDPGEPYMKKVLELAGGTFNEEKDWFERTQGDWVLLFTEFQP
ncbi:N-acetylmuramoyl-L-alanine amidase [Leptospira langatensis]|uniref:N-acetylmuramoyl-L-alanine amidase n=1 Tax=Leptospira langatensis TaxID=2484983 RepID=A0A5F1ZV71_9LEPT|nr:peptidoglycan recognition family protein [Leptospira langatensis]TGK00279.1 N-acetylmuramoyl-L-alanine amidase [Leptospira langatensis]TGL41086.1 N-acetylmuramoyl-L-alanine amidase [Leptospira langatensis]